MVACLKLLLHLTRALCQSRTDLVVENLALRQQLLVLQNGAKRARLTPCHRLFWVWLSQLWCHWKVPLMIVQPETVIGWHHQAFRWFWRWKSRRQLGRKPLDGDLRQLIRTMSQQNPLWGAPRLHGELLKLGFSVAQRTVAKYLVTQPRSPCPQAWKTFLRNHLSQTVSVDFLSVPTITFRVLHVFIVLWHERRQVLHFNITESPSASWTGQQLREAFAFGSPPKYLLRDRDSIYGQAFRQRCLALGLEERRIAPHAPWQSPYVERLIGSIRRECLDHVIVFDAEHLHRVLASYFDYYHHARTHLSLDKDAPEPRPVQPAERGRIVALPQVGGLHHRYERQAA
jgi:transposase InsO family protein